MLQTAFDAVGYPLPSVPFGAGFFQSYLTKPNIRSIFRKPFSNHLSTATVAVAANHIAKSILDILFKPYLTTALETDAKPYSDSDP
jgi:hypothetical protein